MILTGNIQEVPVVAGIFVKHDKVTGCMFVVEASVHHHVVVKPYSWVEVSEQRLQDIQGNMVSW